MVEAGTAVGSFAIAVLLWRAAEVLQPADRMPPFAVRRGRWWALTCVSALSVVSGVSMAQMVSDQPVAMVFMLLAAVAPGLAWIDVRSMLLPYSILGVLAFAALLVFSVSAWRAGSTESLERAVACGLVVAGSGWACWRSVKDQVGLGDIALLGVTSLFLGWWSAAAVTLGVALACLLWWVAFVVVRLGRGSAGSFVPLGPAILFGWWTATALAVSGEI